MATVSEELLGLTPPTGAPLLPRGLVGTCIPGGTMLPASFPKILTNSTTTLWPARLSLIKLTTLVATLTFPVEMLFAPPVLSLVVFPPELA